MPRQISAKNLKVSQNRVGSTTGNRRTQAKCPGCARKSGANDNVQILKLIRNKFADRGLLAEAPDNSTAQADAMAILSSMGIGVITKTPKAPNPRSENNEVSRIKADFSLLKLETDTTAIPNANLFDNIEFSKKAGSVDLVPVKNLYTPPSELAVDEQSNIFKPDDNLTDVERGNNIRLEKKHDANLIILSQKLINQQTILGNRQVKLMSPIFKVSTGKIT